MENINIYKPEQQEELGNIWVYKYGSVFPLVPDAKPSKDLKIFDANSGIYITVQDMSLDFRGDYQYPYDENGNPSYLFREKMPKELADFLDLSIKKECIDG